MCFIAHSLNNKYPLTLVDLSIDLIVFNGWGQEEVEQYRQIFVTEMEIW